MPEEKRKRENYNKSLLIRNPTDRKWMDALRNYLADGIMPYYEEPGGAVDAERTIERFAQMLLSQKDPLPSKIPFKDIER